MKILTATIGVFKVLLLFCMVCNAGSAVAQGSYPITIPSIPAKSLCDVDFAVGAVPSNPHHYFISAQIKL